MVFAKNIIKDISNNISKNLSGKYSQKLLDHNKKSAADALKVASKKVIQKSNETANLNGNKIADNITGTPKIISSKTVDVEFEKLIEILRERCISSGKRKQIIDGIRLL